MARSRSIDYRVGFTGDTSQLEAAIKKATDSLTKLGTSPDALRKGIDGAARSALELSQHLNTAFNQDTGKLDLIKFQQSLKASGKSIQDYATSLRSLGPQGEQAFLEVASAISKAELPLRRTNNLIKQFGVTLWNTARWRITTGAINAIVGGMQQAMGYAKSLDSSLNNIRIVTGKSAEEMAQFAKEANTAAKALSTTTTTYTDASLIYYQQGLDTEAVKQRTEATIKMANVTGQSAETISSQMTAIWENFDDGSRSLESFGDSMVALGATTAASSKEIAEGLQKFAPIAQTVGLSFDYASAALTTIVANTRESASVAGTALKTLFSRLEGLKLGETLEDGTDLNKYSNALMAVGINIKDVSGELKDMDTILDELGAKWQTLAKDQQMALAETIGGVRQYAQLVALMDNWGDFQKNLVTSQTSEGALQRQADIYAESWEAARKRIKAATEDIYDSFINPDQFIALDNVFTPLLTGIASAVDALGGLTGMLPLVVMLMNNAFGDKIAQSLRNMTVNIGLMTGAEQKRARALQQTIAEEAHLLGINREDNSVASTKVEILKEEVALQAEINSKIDQMPAAQKEALNNELQMVDILKQEALAAAEIVEAREQAAENARIDIWSGASKPKNITDTNQLFGNHQIAGNTFIDPKAISLTNDFDEAVKKLTEQLEKSVSASVSAESHIKNLSNDFKGDANAANAATEAARTFLTTIGQPVKTDAGIQEIIKKLREVKTEATDARGVLRAALTNLNIDPSQINTFVAAIARLTEAGMDSATALDALRNGAIKTEEIIQTSSTAYIDWADTLVKVGTSASQVAMAIRAIGNLKDIFSEDSELTSSEKLSQGLMSIAMITPLIGKTINPVVSKFKELNTLKDKVFNMQNEVNTLSKASKEAQDYVKDLEALKGSTRNYRALQTELAGATEAAGVAANKKIIADKALAEAETEVAVASQAATASMLQFIAIGAAVVGIALLIKHIQKVQEEIRKANQAKVEAADKAREEIQENQKLIESYETALEAYKQNNEEKDKLIETSEALAEVYGAEGLALAKLTGDYSKFTTRIKNEQQKQLKEQKDTLLAGIQGTIDLKRDSAELGSGGLDTDQIEDFKRLGLEDFVTSNRTINAKPNNINELLQNRASFAEALTQVDEDTDKNVKAYIEEAIKKYDEIIALVQDNLTQVATIDVQLMDVPTINNFDNYKTWVEDAKEVISKYNLSESATMEAIQTAATNLGLDEWVQVQNIVDDVTADLERHPALLAKAQNYLNNVNSLEQAEVAAYLPWSAVDDNGNNLNKLIENTENYVDALKNGAQAAVDLAAGQKLLNNIGSEFKVKDLEKYAEFLKSINVEMESFLFMDESEQRRIVNQGIQSKYEEQQEEYNQQIAALQANKQEIINRRDSIEIDPHNLYHYSKNQDDWFDVDTYSKMYQNAYLAALENTDEKTKDAAIAAAKAKLEESLNNQDLSLTDGQRQSLIDGIIGANGDYSLAAEKIKDIFSKIITDPSIASYIQSNIDLENIKTNITTITEAQDNNRLAWEANEVSMARSAKTLGELNRLYREGSVRSLKAYEAGIVKLAKQTPKASKALDEYYKALSKGEAGAEEAAEALQKMLIALKDDSLSTAAEKIQKITKELQQAGATISGDQGKLDTTSYTNKINEIAEAIGEAFGYTVHADWVTSHEKVINGLLSDDIAIVQNSAQKIDWSAFWHSDEFKSQAQEIDLQFQDLESWINEFEGVSINIDGSADFSDIISEFQNVETASQDLVALLALLSSSNISFTVEGLEAVQAAMARDYEAEAASLASTGIAISPELLRTQAIAAAFQGLKIQSQGGPTTPYGGTTGGGGGGGNKNTKDLKKDLKDIEDRYHKINREIARQERILTKIDKQLNRTYGRQRFALYEQQFTALTKEIELLGAKSDEAMVYLRQDKAILQGELFEGFNIKFDEAEIDDYDAFLKQIVDSYNNFIDDYEAGIKNASEEDIKIWEERKEKEDKLFQDRIDAAKKYEDSVDTVNAIAHQIEDKLREQEDNKLNEITYKMELVLDVREAKKQINDFSKTIEESFGDAITHGTKAIFFDDKNAQIEMDMYEHYVEEYNALHQRLAEANEYTDTTAIIEELKELEGNIIESGEALLEWLETVENMYVEALDAAAERFDWFTNQIAHDTDVLGMIKELYALQGITYKTQAGFNQLQKTSMGQYQGYLRQAQLNKTWYEEASTRLQEAEKALVGIKETDVNYDALKKNRDALLEEADKAQKAMLENAKSAMETARQMYLDQIDRLNYELEQQLTENIGFDLLEEKYDHFLEETDRYLDPIEEDLETAAWQMKLQNDINKTSNNLYKQRLKDLQEEINLRRENNTLSQYDLDILEAKYRVLQATMDLEDSRNNKNQLRLVRDSNGNWNYQYTANPNDVATKEEELLRAKKDEWEIQIKYAQDYADQIAKLPRELENALDQINKEETLTDAEREARMAETIRYYTKKRIDLQNLLEEVTTDMPKTAVESDVLAAGFSESVFNTSSETIQEIVRALRDKGGPKLIATAGTLFENLQEVLKNDLADKFGNTSEEVQQHIKDIVAGENNEGTLEWMTKGFMTNIADIVEIVERNFLPAIESYVPRANEIFEEFSTTIENTAKAIGVDPNNLMKMTQDVTLNIDNLYNSGKIATTMMYDQLDAVQKLQKGYLELASAIMETVRKMDTELLRGKILPEIEATVGDVDIATRDYDPNHDYAIDMWEAIKANDTKALEDAKDFRDAKIEGEGYSKSTYIIETSDLEQMLTRAFAEGYEEIIDKRREQGESIGNILNSLFNRASSGVTGAIAGAVLGTMFTGATGGYTGEFEGGKLGILHEKELLLNASDTQNILEAVHIMRGISDSVFNGIANSLNSAGVASMALLGSHLGGTPAVAAGGSLEQHVTIEQVNFPGVTSSREIEEAFENLVNDAAQWIQRRKS